MDRTMGRELVLVYRCLLKFKWIAECSTNEHSNEWTIKLSPPRVPESQPLTIRLKPMEQE